MGRWSKNSGVSSADEATKARETEIRGIFDKIIDYYSPGGGFGQGTEAMLQRQEKQYLGQATQGLISAGLFGTSMLSAAPKKFQEEIGIPTRAKLEDIRAQAYTGALGQKAGFIERIEDSSPSYELMAGLTQQANAAPEPSLDSWLAENFGSVPKATTTKRTTSGGGQSLAEIQAIKERLANYTSPRVEMSQAFEGLNDPEWARDIRKQNSLYLGS